MTTLLRVTGNVFLQDSDILYVLADQSVITDMDIIELNCIIEKQRRVDADATISVEQI